MSPASYVLQLLPAGHPTWLILRSPGAKSTLAAIRTGGKCLSFDLENSWDMLLLAFGISEGRPCHLPPRPRCLLIFEEIQSNQVDVLENLLQWAQDKDCQIILAGTEAGWEQWREHAKFYTQDKVVELSGLSLNVCSL